MLIDGGGRGGARAHHPILRLGLILSLWCGGPVITGSRLLDTSTLSIILIQMILTDRCSEVGRIRCLSASERHWTATIKISIKPTLKGSVT